MKKKKFSNEDGKFTYEQNRACRNCGAPIPDQEHATREFCPVTYDDDGKVRDCKTKFHREKDKPDRNDYSELINKHKSITTRIDFLIKKKGFEVATEDLDVYEIMLRQAIDFKISNDGILTSYYLKHTIISNPITDIHKILYNEK